MSVFGEIPIGSRRRGGRRRGLVGEGGGVSIELIIIYIHK